VEQAEEHEADAGEQGPAAGQQDSPMAEAESSSNMTPAPAPASAMPAVSTVSMRMVGMTISLAGMATT
jgi:hypothetical protein